MAKATTSTDVAAPGSDLLTITPEQAQMAYKVLQGEIVPDYNPEEMSRIIAQRIQDATTPEEVDAVFASQEERKLPSWRDTLMGVSVKVERLHFNPSSLEGMPVYAVVDVVTKDGITHTVGIGGQNVLYQLVKMVEMQRTDRFYRLTSKTAASGNDVYWLEDVKDA